MTDIRAAVDLISGLAAPVLPLLPGPVGAALGAVLGIARAIAATGAQWREAAALAREAVDAWASASEAGRARVRTRIQAAVAAARDASSHDDIYDERSEFGPGRQR